MPMPKFRKVVILGYRSVGKSSLALQFVKGHFADDYDPTIENTLNKSLMIGEDEFQLQLVDTAGQDEYSLLPHSFVLGIHGYVLVYSVTSFKSFVIAKIIHSKLQDRRGKGLMPIVLVGNKTDLASQNREVKVEDGKKLADKWGAAFMEASAKDGEKCHSIFTKIIEEIDRVEKSFGDERKCALM
ncbi:GTPase RhebL1 isoform X1 [Microcaecilia unicolor]|uniref:GTP-binding protein Rheb n=1 Tax=Microcaecilia unicolor TaxID=1415580 RepID=A0A6P7XLA5_9AMPH|nr:GTPase RhebL1 isoform X1 [Microcaecilia unicolor]